MRGLIVLYCLPAVALLLNMFLPVGVSGFLLLLLCLPLCWFMKDRIGLGLILALAGLCVGMLVIFTGEETKKFFESPRLEQTTPAEAAGTDPKTFVFRFRDARVWPEYGIEYQYRTQGKNARTESLFIAPLTEQSWTPDKPVHAWAVSETLRGRSEWHDAINAGVRRDGSRALEHAVKKAESDHSLTAAENPLFLKWVNPDFDYQRQVRQLKAGLLYPAPGWIILWTFIWVFWRRPASPQDSETEAVGL